MCRKQKTRKWGEPSEMELWEEGQWNTWTVRVGGKYWGQEGLISNKWQGLGGGNQN